jgi:hypothetical protein
MQIELKDARAGDFVLFRGKGPVFKVISFLLCFCDLRWRWLKWKPWHTAFITEITQGQAVICETTAVGIVENPLSRHSDYKIYRWLDQEPNGRTIRRYLGSHLGKKYDVAIYFWTALQYLIRHYWNRRIPRLLDDRYTCWENAWEFAEYCGKPIGSKYDCPMITDLCRALNIK